MGIGDTPQFSSILIGYYTYYTYYTKSSFLGYHHLWKHPALELGIATQKRGDFTGDRPLSGSPWCRRATLGTLVNVHTRNHWMPYWQNRGKEVTEMWIVTTKFWIYIYIRIHYIYIYIILYIWSRKVESIYVWMYIYIYRDTCNIYNTYMLFDGCLCDG